MKAAAVDKRRLILDAAVRVFARQDEIRRSLPSLANRRPEAYRWPAEVHA